MARKKTMAELDRTAKTVLFKTFGDYEAATKKKKIVGDMLKANLR